MWQKIDYLIRKPDRIDKVKVKFLEEPRQKYHEGDIPETKLRRGHRLGTEYMWHREQIGR